MKPTDVRPNWLRSETETVPAPTTSCQKLFGTVSTSVPDPVLVKIPLFVLVQPSVACVSVRPSETSTLLFAMKLSVLARVTSCSQMLTAPPPRLTNGFVPRLPVLVIAILPAWISVIPV